MLRPIAIATAISGTLDIIFAMLLTVLFGRQIGTMLRFVASGPFPAATDLGSGGALLGLVVHFGLMAIMASALMIAVHWRPELAANPIVLGLVFGLTTYVVMNLIVVPVRFSSPLPPRPISIATQLFAHIVLVGLPMAYVARRYFR
jgi:hypothetical protein